MGQHPNVDTVGKANSPCSARRRKPSSKDSKRGTKGINDLSGGVILRDCDRLLDRPDEAHGMKPTNAIRDGFFQVEKDGERYLTRAGNFSVDARGNMLTQEGEHVLSSGGTPVIVDPELGPAGVGDDGAVYQIGPDGQRVAVTDLAVVKPGSLGDLVKRGENRFFPLGPVTTVPPDQRRLRSGYLEHSGVQATSEMMQLIEASRAMEMNVNMIRNHDQMLSGITNRMLRQA
jgi:flagellar basal body rod protein FlgG